MYLDDSLKQKVITQLNLGQVPMLFGEPGIGKSSWVEGVARDMGAKYFCLACNQLAAKEDLTGARIMEVADASGNRDYAQMFFPHTVIAQAIAYANEHPAERVLLFLDELNRTTPDVTSELLSIPTMRSLGDRPIPSNVLIITAGNNHGNVTPLDEASISRFITYTIEPSLDTFLEVNPELNKYIAATLRKHPDRLFCKQVADKVESTDDESEFDLDALLDDDGTSQITTPRTISGLSAYLDTLSDHDLVAALANTRATPAGEISELQETVEAYVGHTLFAIDLIVTISDSVTRVPQSATASITRPFCYDAIVSAGTVSDLDAIVQNLSDDDRSAALLYACYDKSTPTTIATGIAKHVTHFAASDLQQFVAGVANHAFNQKNVDAFFAASTPLSIACASMLGV